MQPPTNRVINVKGSCDVIKAIISSCILYHSSRPYSLVTQLDVNTVGKIDCPLDQRIVQLSTLEYTLQLSC